MAGGTDLTWAAVEEAVAGIIHLEKEYDSNKLGKNIRSYCHKAAKNLAFRTKPLWDLINDYADAFFSSVFGGLGDRKWLSSGQADFILVLDAGIKDNFPPNVWRSVSGDEFEQMVLAAHDRAFEEQRFYVIMTEAISSNVSGPKTKKRVWNAVEEGRKDAASSAVQPEDFAACWINRTIGVLAENAGGNPEGVLDADTACALFHALVEGGGLPMAMTQETGPPPAGWPLIEEAVQTAYITHTVIDEAVAGAGGKGAAAWGAADGAWASEPAAKKFKGAAAGVSFFSKGKGSVPGAAGTHAWDAKGKGAMPGAVAHSGLREAKGKGAAAGASGFSWDAGKGDDAGDGDGAHGSGYGARGKGAASSAGAGVHAWDAKGKGGASAGASAQAWGAKCKGAVRAAASTQAWGAKGKEAATPVVNTAGHAWDAKGKSTASEMSALVNAYGGRGKGATLGAFSSAWAGKSNGLGAGGGVHAWDAKGKGVGKADPFAEWQ